MELRERTRQAEAARNRFVALCAVLTALVMVGAAYAAVPLYFAFCRATGFAGTTQVAAAAPALKGQCRAGPRLELRSRDRRCPAAHRRDRDGLFQSAQSPAQ
jgi:hypothetical protein